MAVSYAAFGHAYGGDFGSRLRLVQLPRCALTTPQRSECRTVTPIKSSNDSESQTVVAEVPAAGSGTVLGMTTEDRSSQGSFAATALAASASWNVALSSGDFSWSYPMKSTPVPGGLQPGLSLDYSSQVTDGRTAATNNQGSWIGEGFAYEPGYLERRYKPCLDDGHDTVGDLCWAHQNATLSLGGRAGELVKVNDNTWKLPDDDGSKIERIVGASNGDNDGEYWKLTTTDGTQYFFGRNRLPGWTGAAGQSTTNSTWTVPVYGDDSGEPCHKSSGIADSYCDQAWRWNLDYVKDRHGNVISYFYDVETNHYARGAKFDVNGAPYHRGGYLKRIDYGQRDNQVYTTKAPARVQFTTAERCLDASGCGPGDLSSGSAARWRDVPFELHCAVNTHCEFHQASPSFWTRKRLSKITTEARTNTGWAPVNSWSLTHEFANNSDASYSLWLRKITHTGYWNGDDITLPAVELIPLQLPNRIDVDGDHISDLIRPRLNTIHTDTGGQVDVNYAPADCAAGSLPKPGESTRRCFPVRWNPLGTEDPITDWFHKYVVAETIETDRTGGNPDMVTRRSYAGDAGWRKAKPDGITKPEDLTWSDWRGYGKVTVRRGSAQTMTTRTDHTFLRGLHGNAQATGGTRSVPVSDSTGGTHTDHDELSGHELETTVYDGNAVVSKAVNTPWLHHTHTHTEHGATRHSSLTRTSTARTLTALKPENGQARWRETKTVTAHDPTWGRATRVDDLGDVATDTDDRCTRTSYVDNATAYLYSFVSRVETVAVRCAVGSPDRATQQLTDTRTSYDGLAHGAAPTFGDVTKTEELKSHNGTAAAYVATATTTVDSHGRPLTVKDALGNTTGYAYTEANRLTTQVKTTNPLLHSVTTELDTAYGLTVATVDANSKRTDLRYDALGRLTGVWLPNRPKTGDQTPSIRHTYLVRADQPVVIKTEKVKNDGGYRAAYQLYDGLLRPRQTQAEGPDGGWLLTDTYHTPTGKTDKTNALYHALGTPGATPIIVPEGSVNGQTSFAYDGVDRATAEIFSVAGDGRWRAITSYDGDRVNVDPPTGGTATTTVSDARGNTTELHQYHGSSPTGAADITRYTYTPAGSLATVVDPAGNTWRYRYDQRNLPIEAEDPDTGTTTHTYDDLGRRVSTTDSRNETRTSVYDALGRKTQTWRGSPSSGIKLAEWAYDPAAYKGQLHWSARYVNGKAYGITTTERDALYRPQRVVYTIPADAGAGLARSYDFTTGYNLDDTVQRIGMPEAGGLPVESIATTYDDLLRPTALTGHSSYVTGTEYTRTGQLMEATLDTGGKKAWLRWEHERGTGRLARTRLDRQTAAEIDTDAEYEYDHAGNVLSIADTPAGGPRDIQCFNYDHLRRLTDAWATDAATDDPCAGGPDQADVGGPAPYHESWTFDAVGNRLTETQHSTTGGDPTVRTYTYPAPRTPQPHTLRRVDETGPGGVKTYTYDYDTAGNTTQRTPAAGEQELAWDAEGHLASVTAEGKITSFVYDADGNRLLRKEPDGTTLYLPGMELRLDQATKAVTGTRFYTFGGRTIAVRTKDGVHFQAADHHGTASANIDAISGAITWRRTTPYGGPRGPQPDAWPDQKGFVGGTKDPTSGLTHLGAREYDPAIGRFISADPIVDHTDPQQIQGYAYSNNTPVTTSDPSGLQGSASCTGGTVGGPGRCTGNENSPPDKKQSPGGGSKSSTRVHSNGTIEHHNSRGNFINRVNVDDALLTPGAPTYRELVSGVDRYVGERPPGEGVDMYDSTITWNLIWLATTTYRLDDIGRFANYAHNGDPELLAASLDGSMVGALPVGRGRMRFSVPRIRVGKCNSFDPDTSILMADGSRKKIKDIRVGDEVAAAMQDSVDEQGKYTVTALHANQHDGDLVDVVVRGHDGVPRTIRTTAEHRFWDETARTWKPAGALAVGHYLRDADGSRVRVHSVVARAGASVMLDISVDTAHTYFVVAGATPILVHNTGPNCGTAFGKTANGADEFHGSEYSLDEMVEFVNGHTDDGNPTMGRPSGTEVEAALRGAVPEPMPGTGTRSKFEHNGVRVIINFDKPWRSTAYYPGQ